MISNIMYRTGTVMETGGEDRNALLPSRLVGETRWGFGRIEVGNVVTSDVKRVSPQTIVGNANGAAKAIRSTSRPKLGAKMTPSRLTCDGSRPEARSAGLWVVSIRQIAT